MDVAIGSEKCQPADRDKTKTPKNNGDTGIFQT